MIRDSLRTLQYVVEVIVTYNPLKLFLLLCLLLSALALATFAWWIFSPQPALLIVASTFIGFSFLWFGIGLLAFVGKRQPFSR